MIILSIVIIVLVIVIIFMKLGHGHVVRSYRDDIRRADEWAEEKEREVKEARDANAREIAKREVTLREVANAVKAERAAAVKQIARWVTITKADANAIQGAFGKVMVHWGCDDIWDKASRKLGRALGEELTACQPDRVVGASETLDDLVARWADADETEE